MKKHKGPRVATGLNLWEVEIRYRYLTGRCPGTLWITTPQRSMQRAMEKTEIFLSGSKEYDAAEIMAIEHRGIIDA